MARQREDEDAPNRAPCTHLPALPLRQAEERRVLAEHPDVLPPARGEAFACYFEEPDSGHT